MTYGAKAIPITDSVYWVGAIDWSARDFHGYLTSRGTTYNAYLVLADKITLIDTVKKPFVGEMLSRIADVINPSKIDYVVSNHSEPDHSSALPEIIAAVQPDKVFASVMGSKTLARYYRLDNEIIPVKDGETLSLGNLNLAFVDTKMLHWPDSMFSYLPERQVLFSQDAFGMHLAGAERFADEVHDWILNYEATKYYANILTPVSPLVLKLLERVAGMNLDIKYLCTDHGPVWRRDLDSILGKYQEWATQDPTNKAVIVYDTMWGSTALMANAYAEGVQAGGGCVKLMPLNAAHRSDVATELLEAGALLAGSPTMNNGLFPTLSDTLVYLKGLKRRNLIGAAFGSYGWSGEAPGQVGALLEEMKVEMVREPFKAQYLPTNEELSDCYETGRQIGERLASNCPGKVL